MVEDRKLSTETTDNFINVAKQDLTKLEKTIENIKSEWTGNIRNHEEEIKGYKQSYQILNEISTNSFQLNFNFLPSQLLPSKGRRSFANL